LGIGKRWNRNGRRKELRSDGEGKVEGEGMFGEGRGWLIIVK